MAKLLQVNQKINLVPLPKKEGAGQGQPLTTYIAEITGDTLKFAAPIYRGRFVYFPPGQEVMVWFPGRTALYAFTSKVVDNVPGPSPLLVLQYPTEIVRRQRRRFVRVEFVSPVTVEFLTGEDQGRCCRGYAVDLGGGGVRLVMGRFCVPGTRVRLDLQNFPLAGIVGRVLRSYPCEDRRDRWEWAVEFAGLTSRERDRIIKFVLARQRELRQKGLL